MRIVYGYVEGCSLNEHRATLSKLGVIETKTLGFVEGERLAFAALLSDVALPALPVTFDTGVLVGDQKQRMNRTTSTSRLCSLNAMRKRYRKMKNAQLTQQNWKQHVSRNRALQVVSFKVPPFCQLGAL